MVRGEPPHFGAVLVAGGAAHHEGAATNAGGSVVRVKHREVAVVDRRFGAAAAEVTHDVGVLAVLVFRSVC